MQYQKGREVTSRIGFESVSILCRPLGKLALDNLVGVLRTWGSCRRVETDAEPETWFLVRRQWKAISDIAKHDVLFSAIRDR